MCSRLNPGIFFRKKEFKSPCRPCAVVLVWLDLSSPSCCLLSRLHQFGVSFPMEDRTRTRHLSIPGSSRLAHPRANGAWSPPARRRLARVTAAVGASVSPSLSASSLALLPWWQRWQQWPPASFAQGGHSSSQQPPLPRTITLAMNPSMASVRAAMACPSFRAPPSVLGTGPHGVSAVNVPHCTRPWTHATRISSLW